VHVQAVFTARNDVRTCLACRAADGRVVEVESLDYLRWMPPYVACTASECRCVYEFRHAER
jgi:hypothetical protein